MEASDHTFDRALLYLRAAGHDTGEVTRARLLGILRSQHEHHSLSTEQMLDQLPQWFSLPNGAKDRLLPHIIRGSIGYPRD